jgi:hypothetical protein
MIWALIRLSLCNNYSHYVRWQCKKKSMMIKGDISDRIPFVGGSIPYVENTIDLSKTKKVFLVIWKLQSVNRICQVQYHYQLSKQII